MKNKRQKDKPFTYTFFPKNCKGSNVGFAIAFVLFVSFIVFLFNMMGPVGKVESDKYFLLKHLENKIIENTSSELTMTSVKTQNGNLIKIYEGEGLNPTYTINPNEDEIGLIRKDEYVFETKVISLIDEYNTNYDGLKDYFNVPKVNDFEFGFKYSNGTEISTKIKEIPSTDVFAEEVSVTYVSKDAGIGVGYIRVVLW